MSTKHKHQKKTPTQEDSISRVRSSSLPVSEATNHSIIEPMHQGERGTISSIIHLQYNTTRKFSCITLPRDPDNK